MKSNDNVTAFKTDNVIKNLDEANKIIQTKKEVIIYYSQKECIYCKELNKYLNKLNSEDKENIYVFYVEKENKDMIKSKFGFSYTPTLIYYQNSKESDRLNNDLLFKDGKSEFNDKGETELKNWLHEKEEE